MSTCSLSYESIGPAGASTLLLGGSLGSTLLMWDPQLAPLSRRYRLVRFDHRGHGGSPVPRGPYSIEELAGDVLSLLNTLGIERTSYCGLSLGGMVGMWLAANAPERIDRLVLICTSAHIGSSAYAERAAAVRAAGTTEAVADAVVARWFTETWTAAHPELVARYKRMLAATPAEGYAACCEAIDALDLRADLPRISAPTLVIAAAEDPATPPAHGRAIADSIAAARPEVLEAAAHLASVQQADLVTRLIAEHLEAAT